MSAGRLPGAARSKRGVLALGMVVMVVLSACLPPAGGPTSPPSEPGRPPIDRPGKPSPDLSPPKNPNINTTLKVWLIEDGTPQSLIDRVNAQFHERYPNVDVEIEIQQWDGIEDTLGRAFRRGNTPCVSELGNTLVTGFAAGDLLTDLTDVAPDLGEGEWLTGLAKPGLWDGSRWSIPYFGGVRVVLYNKEHFAQAGAEVPLTFKEFLGVLEKLAAAKGRPSDGYSPFYFPGSNVFGSLPFIWGYGGGIAELEDGQWRGRLTEATSRDGLDVLNRVVQEYSAAPRDANVAGNAAAFATGDVGMVLDLWWIADDIVALSPDLRDKIGLFPLPGVSTYETAPVFMGGSDLVIPAKCRQKGLALEWVKLITNLENQTFFANEGLIIPNTPAATAGLPAIEALQAANEASTVAFFTPVTPRWALVEREKVLPRMLVSIFTGAATVEEATTLANAELEALLNGP